MKIIFESFEDASNALLERQIERLKNNTGLRVIDGESVSEFVEEYCTAYTDIDGNRVCESRTQRKQGSKDILNVYAIDLTNRKVLKAEWRTQKGEEFKSSKITFEELVDVFYKKYVPEAM